MAHLWCSHSCLVHCTTILRASPCSVYLFRRSTKQWHWAYRRVQTHEQPFCRILLWQSAESRSHRHRFFASLAVLLLSQSPLFPFSSSFLSSPSPQLQRYEIFNQEPKKCGRIPKSHDEDMYWEQWQLQVALVQASSSINHNHSHWSSMILWYLMCLCCPSCLSCLFSSPFFLSSVSTCENQHLWLQKHPWLQTPTNASPTPRIEHALQSIWNSKPYNPPVPVAVHAFNRSISVQHGLSGISRTAPKSMRLPDETLQLSITQRPLCKLSFPSPKVAAYPSWRKMDP